MSTDAAQWPDADPHARPVGTALRLWRQAGAARGRTRPWDRATSRRSSARNGVGKSTLMRTLIGLLPRHGRDDPTFEGRDISGRNRHQRACSASAMSRKGRDVFPRMTVEENLLRRRDDPSAPGSRDYDRGLRLLPDPAGAAEAARPARCRAASSSSSPSAGRWSASPSLILLDEPSEGIQPLDRPGDRRGSSSN